MQLFDRNRENFKLIDREFLRIIDLILKKSKIDGIKVFLYNEKIKIIFDENNYQMIFDCNESAYNVYVNGKFKEKYNDAIVAFSNLYSFVYNDFFETYYNRIICCNEKICNNCGETLDLEKFYNRYDSRDGKRSSCKICFDKKHRRKKKIKDRRNKKND